MGHTVGSELLQSPFVSSVERAASGNEKTNHRGDQGDYPDANSTDPEEIVIEPVGGEYQEHRGDEPDQEQRSAEPTTINPWFS